VIRSESPFLVGIDLGTTNSAVAFVDTRRGGRVQLFRVPQLTAPGLVEPYPVLPSFLFFPDILPPTTVKMHGSFSTFC